MKLVVGGLVAALCAGALAACAAIAGLTPYSIEECAVDDCDASVHPKPGDEHVEPTDSPVVGDDMTNPPPGDDGGGDDAGGGCGTALLTCDGGCADPTSASSCGGCGNVCPVDAGLCAPGDAGAYGCVSSCPPNAPTPCEGRCADTTSDITNCGGCGMPCGVGQSCVHSNCVSAPDAGPACPDGGCPFSTPTGFSSCPFGHCNSASGTCSAAGGCFCTNDNQCKSNKCVKVSQENDVSCGTGTNCTGSGSRDGFDCQLASPGIPPISGSVTYACPANSGFKNTTLTCDSTHTNCYCTADNECPSGKCVPSTNNNNCSGCTGTGTPDYRGCQATADPGLCPIYIGCPIYTQCQYPTCYCNNDLGCPSGRCIPSTRTGCSAPNCTGTGTDDGHGCMPAPSSVPCGAMGGSSCITSLTPSPVLNSAKTACLCVADSNCSSGKCVNKDSQCASSTCSGSGSADSEDCQTATSVANAWSCSAGNCSNVSSSSGTCNAAGIPCWCTSDSQCPSGAKCAAWAGCSADACTATDAGGANTFHCAD